MSAPIIAFLIQTELTNENIDNTISYFKQRIGEVTQYHNHSLILFLTPPGSGINRESLIRVIRKMVTEDPVCKNSTFYIDDQPHSQIQWNPHWLQFHLDNYVQHFQPKLKNPNLHEDWTNVIRYWEILHRLNFRFSRRTLFLVILSDQNWTEAISKIIIKSKYETKTKITLSFKREGKDTESISDVPYLNYMNFKTPSWFLFSSHWVSRIH